MHLNLFVKAFPIPMYSYMQNICVKKTNYIQCALNKYTLYSILLKNFLIHKFTIIELQCENYSSHRIYLLFCLFD